MPTFKPGQLEPVATKTFRPEALEVISDEPASDDAPVVNEQRVGDTERTILNTLGLGGESQVKWLQERGYEAGLDDEGVKVRRKGEKDFGRIEPQGFLAGKGLLGKGAELIRDFTQDAGDEWASGVGTVKGAALLGGAGTALGPVGTVAGGIAGAGIGAATAEAARRLAGKAAGFKESGGEFASGVGEQALLGGVAQGGGALLGAGIKKAKGLLTSAGSKPNILTRAGEKLQVPERWHKQDVKTRRATSALQDVNDRFTQKQTEIFDIKDDLRKAGRSVATTRAELAELEHAHRAALRKEVEGAAKDLDVDLKEGQKRAFDLAGETFQKTETITSKTGGGDRWRIDFASDIARPDSGISVAALRAFPKLGALLRKHFGANFAVPIAQKGERGWEAMASVSMETRTRALQDLVRTHGEEHVADAAANFSRDLAAWMLAPENVAFREGLDQAALLKLAKSATGQVTPESASVTFRILQTKLTGKIVPPELQAAREAYDAAILGQKKATAGLKGSPLQDELADLSKEKGLRLADTRRERNLRSQISPEKPWGTPMRHLAAGAGRGGLVGGAVGSLLGAPWVGAAVGSIAAPAIERLGMKAASQVGKVLSALGNIGTSREIIASAPEPVRPILAAIQKILKAQGPDVAKAALYLAMKESAPLREMLSEKAGTE